MDISKINSLVELYFKKAQEIAEKIYIDFDKFDVLPKSMPKHRMVEVLGDKGLLFDPVPLFHPK